MNVVSHSPHKFHPHMNIVTIDGEQVNGTVDKFDGNTFDLFTGSSYLCGVKLKTCRYEKISENVGVQL